MSFKQVFHERQDLNNKIIEGDGIFDSLGNFIKNNKDSISSLASLAGGVKSVINTIDDHKKAAEELKQLRNNTAKYKKVLDLQSQLKQIKDGTTLSNRSEPVNSESNSNPITYYAKKIENFNNGTSTLSESQLNAIRNMNKRGEGVRKRNSKHPVSKPICIGNGLRIY
jgi:uncharacterized phage infection (PIP) family protein YhgE